MKITTKLDKRLTNSIRKLRRRNTVDYPALALRGIAKRGPVKYRPFVIPYRDAGTVEQEEYDKEILDTWKSRCGNSYVGELERLEYKREGKESKQYQRISRIYLCSNN